MTRESFRDALGEVWKEGVLTMQVFNAMHDGFEELAVTELKDAVLAYDKHTNALAEGRKPSGLD